MAYPRDMRYLTNAPSLAAALAVSAALHGLALYLVAGGLGAGGSAGRPTTHLGALSVVALPLATPRPTPPVPRQPAQEPSLDAAPATPSEPAAQAPAADDTVPGEASPGQATGWPAYFPAHVLDERPRVVQDIPPNLPELDSYPQGGTLRLTLRINATGSVDRIDVDATTLPEAFTEQTVRAFSGARFTPGRRHGQAVGTLLRIEVSYAPLQTPRRDMTTPAGRR